MFYHARMPNAERLEVERLFREGGLRVVVATSAFGEGIDLPDVRNVVLYHLNFDSGEFNQQAGRAGRDGARGNPSPLRQNDRTLNEYLIDLDAPSLQCSAKSTAGSEAWRLKIRTRRKHGDCRNPSDRPAGPDRRGGATNLRRFESGRAAEDDEGRYVRSSRCRGASKWSETSVTPKARRRGKHSRVSPSSRSRARRDARASHQPADLSIERPSEKSNSPR